MKNIIINVHICAYCGCDLEYKDMQVDHVKSVYANTDFRKTMTEEEMYREKNLTAYAMRVLAEEKEYEEDYEVCE